MSSEGVIAARRIQICLFLVELSLAISMVMVAYVLLNVLPFSLYWASGICSTMALVWLIKAVLGALESLKNRVAALDGSNATDNDILRNNESDVLKSYESMQERRLESQFTSERDSKSVSFDDQNSSAPLEISQTKQFLIDMEDEKNAPIETIAFHLLAVLATVLLQFAVRVLVIVQNIRRSLPRRRRANSDKMQWSDTPFTIGRNMSSSGASFHIFSFLNKWLECGDDTNPDSHVRDSSISIKAVSFDRISVGSSFITIYPPRQNPSARSQLSWLGIVFNDIDICVEMHLERKHRTTPGEGVSTNVAQSISLQFKMDAVEIGVFPFAVDWCNGSGMQMNVIASSNAGAKPEHGSIGFDMSVAMNRLHMHRFNCLSPPEGPKTKSKVSVVSWDAIQSSLHLRTKPGISKSNNQSSSTRKPVSLMTFPSGYGLLYDSKCGIVRKKSLPRRIYLTIGDLSCMNMLALGIHVGNLQILLIEGEVLFQNISESMIRTNSITRGSATTEKVKTKKSSVHVGEVKATIALQMYAIQSTSCDDNNGVTLDCFSFQTSRLDILLSKNDLHAMPAADNERSNGASFPLLVVGTREVSVRYEAFSSDLLNESQVAASDPVVFKRIEAKLISHHSPELSKCAIVGWDSIIVRADETVVNKLTSIKNSLEVSKLAVADMQRRALEIQQIHSIIDKPNPSQISDASTENTTKDALERIEISCGSVDVIVELLQSLQPTNTDGMDRNDKLRVTLLQQATSILITRKQSTSRGESYTYGCAHADLQPEQLFYSEVEKCGHHYFVEAFIVRAEGSVTFSPHLALPVIDDDSKFSGTYRPTAVSYYGNFTNLMCLSAVPYNLRMSSPMSGYVSKAIHVSFRSLEVYERYAKRPEIQPSFQLNSIVTQRIGWNMTPTDDIVANRVLIMQCSGSFCLAEEFSNTRERAEMISFQFCKGSNELELVWSPILQWQQVSCSNSIQRALALFSASSSKRKATGSILSSHTTNIRIGVDSDVTAIIHAFVGVKTKARTVIKGGSTMSISFAKYPCPSSQCLKQTTKPGISFRANEMMIHLNDIAAPIFIFEGVTFQNHLRRAHETEINEYISKTQCSDLCGDSIATDHQGHPLKEIFELNFAGRTSAKFPPALHFGEVVDDVVLLPKALFDGLNRMKEDYKKQKPKYQLMSIKCSFSLLDVSLMGDDPNSEVTIMVPGDSSVTPSQPSILRDEFRILFEGTDVSIERNAPPEWTQNQINGLDEDDSTYLFSSSQGGLMSLSMNRVSCALHPLDLGNPLLRVDDFAMNGYLHLAGLCPTNPGVQEGKIVKSFLFCHHNHSADRCLSAQELRSCCCCYGVSLYSSGLPVKVYSDCRVTFGQFHIVYGSVMNNSIPRFMECIQRMLPPPSKSSGQEVSIPLSWWDNIRFFVHGAVSMSADEFSIRWLLDSHTLWDQSIHLVCNKFNIGYLVGSYKIDASTVTVSIPGVAYDTSVHPSARVATPLILQTNETNSGADTKRHPLLFVPSFRARIRFVWEMLEPGGSSSRHHSIYMKPKDGTARCDKFAAFRSDGVNVQFQLELHGNDSVGADNWVALRTDVLPWFTHINSTLEFLPAQNKKKADSFPKFRSVTMKLRVHEMRLVTWFEDEEELDGLCLILRTVNYNASIDGRKEIVLDGPVKAALLDVRGFDHIDNVDISLWDVIDSRARRENISECDPMQGRNDCDMNESLQCTNVDIGTAPFLKLQELSSHIDELDYVVVTDQIDIRNQSMTKILSGCDETDKDQNDGISDLKESQTFDGVDGTTWSILVARCRLLWTIAIRDAIMTISKDLIYTVGFMKSQQRQLQLLSGGTSGEVPIENESYEVTTASIVRVAGEPKSRHRSMLDYLLDENLDVDSTQQDTSRASANSGADDLLEQNPTLPTLEIHFSNPQIQLHSIATGGSIIVAMESADVEARRFVHLLVANLRSKSGNVCPSDLLIRTEQTYNLTNMEAFSHSTRVDINVGLPWLEVCSTKNDRQVTQQSVPLEEQFGINESVFRQITDTSELTWNDEISLNLDERFDDSRTYPYASEEQLTCSNKLQGISHHQYPSNLRRHEPLAFMKSGLLRPILDKFTFQSRQLFHRPPIHNSARELVYFLKQGMVVGQDEAAVDDTELHIDLLNFNLDSYQFKTTIDVIRNVLLEVPKPYRRREYIDQVEDNVTASNETSSRVASAAALHMEDVLRGESKHQGKKGRQMLRTAAMGLMQETEDKIALNGDEVFRRVSYRLSKLQSCIRSHDEIDDVQIDFTGFHGQHDYSTVGSVVSQFSLEDLRVSSSRPSPDSIVFLDPTSIVKSVLGNERSPCGRCDQFFNPSQNDLNSCVFHIGQYKYGKWTCCKSSNAAAPGCRTGPHSGKERAAVIRVETLPRTVEGISLYSHFEVNLFPGIPHKLVLQISKSMSRLLMSYFFVEDDNDDDIDTMLTVSDDASATSDSFSTQVEFSPKPISKKKAMLIGGKGTPYSASKRSNEGVSDSVELRSSVVEAPKKKPEIVFVKVWRVGYVDVNISLGGFKRLPLSSLDICVPAYSKAYEIGTWEYLGKKYLSHLVREVLKSGASSGLEKFRRKMMGSASNPSPSGLLGDLRDSTSSDYETSSTPRMPLPPRLPAMSADSVSVESESSTRLWGRPKGASDILGTPTKKKRSLFSKHSR